jgi:hypothetical protein
MPAPRHNQNARKHGAYSNQRRRAAAAHGSASGGEVEATSPRDSKLPSLPDLILDLWQRQQDLAAWMKSNPGAENGRYLAAASLYGQNASRLARMVKVTTGLGNDKTQKLADALNDALLQTMDEMGIKIE